MPAIVSPAAAPIVSVALTCAAVGCCTCGLVSGAVGRADEIYKPPGPHERKHRHESPATLGGLVVNVRRRGDQMAFVQLEDASGRIEVPVSSLDTGVDLRDEHLHGSGWLDAARFPTAVFEITGVEGATALQPDVEARVTVVGRFTLHGQTRPVRAETRVKLVTTEGPQHLRVRSRFTVNLPSYGVTVPALVRAKVSDNITVNVTLRAN